MKSEDSKNEVRKSIITNQKNMAWLTSQYDKIRKEYGSKFVAAHNGRIVESANTLPELLVKLKDKPYRKVAAISYITKKRPRLLLPSSVF